MKQKDILILNVNTHFTRSAGNFLRSRKEVGRVYTAENLEEALMKLNKFKIDLLLIDEHFLKDSNGKSNQEILAELKTMMPEIIIVVLSLHKRDCCDLDYPHISNWVSRQDFASEMIALLNSSFSPVG